MDKKILGIALVNTTISLSTIILNSYSHYELLKNRRRGIIITTGLLASAVAFSSMQTQRILNEVKKQK